MKPRSLFTVTAILEGLTGILLLLQPVFVVNLLLGSEISTNIEVTISRIAGSGILSLGIACWLARNDENTSAAKALTGGMLVYNFMVFVTLANSAYNSAVTPALIVALIAHLALGIACYNILRKFKRIS
jgi:hypothetical protein